MNTKMETSYEFSMYEIIQENPEKSFQKMDENSNFYTKLDGIFV
jgi:hypothetical protein